MSEQQEKPELIDSGQQPGSFKNCSCIMVQMRYILVAKLLVFEQKQKISAMTNGRRN
jgi:hypothetical protein